MQKVFFSIIIPTCNRADLLAQCLSHIAIALQQPGVPPAEVWVTDDSAGTETETMLRKAFPQVFYTRGPRRGPAANRNNGARLAAGIWLVFLDDDCLPAPGLLKAYAEAIHAEPEQWIFEGAILPVGEQTAFNQECPVNTTGGNLWSCNFCISRLHFIQLQGFDETFPFPAMEDMDLHCRAAAVQPLRFVPAAQVLHPWKTIADPARRFQQAAASLQLFLRKWPAQKKYFGFTTQVKKLLRHFFTNALPNLFRYGLKGITYLWYYYAFLLKTAFFYRGEK